jgi:hypothetical protein
MRDALKRHWPEYLMEAAGLGLFPSVCSRPPRNARVSGCSTTQIVLTTLDCQPRIS